MKAALNLNANKNNNRITIWIVGLSLGKVGLGVGNEKKVFKMR